MCAWSVPHSEQARGAEEEEESGGGRGRREGGGELRLRSTGGKAFGCCSKLSSPISTMGQEKRASVVDVTAVLVGEKETDWLGR